MQATIDRDIIVAIGRGPVTIPDDYPRDVGWERLRWDGERIIDLATLDSMWVERTQAGSFVLHAVEVPGSVLVDMAYSDRKNLSFGGSISVKTAQQLADELTEKQITAIKNYLASNVVKPKELAEVIMVLLGLIAITSEYARTGNITARNYLDAALPTLRQLPIEKIANIAPTALNTLKAVFDSYFSKLESL
jgi:hypothetical protein